jgi:chaperonin GroES
LLEFAGQERHTARPLRWQIRNPNIEIRNKFEWRKNQGNFRIWKFQQPLRSGKFRAGVNNQQKSGGQTMTMTVKPLGDRVLVRPLEEKETKKGGIIIPDTAKEKPQEGKIVALGTGKVDDDGKKIPFEVKKGDRVMYSKYGGTEIKIDGEEHLILREDDILGILE